jgi:hypothetical protein
MSVWLVSDCVSATCLSKSFSPGGCSVHADRQFAPASKSTQGRQVFNDLLAFLNSEGTVSSHRTVGQQGSIGAGAVRSKCIERVDEFPDEFCNDYLAMKPRPVR